MGETSTGYENGNPRYVDLGEKRVVVNLVRCCYV